MTSWIQCASPLFQNSTYGIQLRVLFGPKYRHLVNMCEYQTDSWKLRLIYINFPLFQHLTYVHVLFLSILCNQLIIDYCIKKMNKVDFISHKVMQRWFSESHFCVTASEWSAALLRQQGCCHRKLGLKSRHWSCLKGCHK